ncbi:hypothetical protein KTE54_15565 [Burkholderia multivorans]|uniref:hypothetical protein n=1 Tax=Burkholderia multivorans TaxID=87883 RepID=UPI001C265F45|nr:hypothetical protein [Burkholderia multivorans]MBU9562099.1 hypothetical protein [Burkholderia multivorans]
MLNRRSAVSIRSISASRYSPSRCFAGPTAASRPRGVGRQPRTSLGLIGGMKALTLVACSSDDGVLMRSDRRS